jgi:hypothetical protein
MASKFIPASEEEIARRVPDSKTPAAPEKTPDAPKSKDES